MPRKNFTTEKLFHRLTHNKTDRNRWDSISILRQRNSNEVFQKCLELIQSDILKERIIAVDILAQLGLPPRPFLKETLDTFYELLKKETNNKILCKLLFAIGHNNENLSQAQIESLIKFKNNKSSNIRYALTFALGGIDKNNALDAIIFLSNDKDDDVRDWSTFSLGSLSHRNNKKIRTALLARVEDKNSAVRGEAIKGLTRCKSTEIIEIITRELTNDNSSTLLFEAINELGYKQFLPLLEKELSRAKTDENIDKNWKNALTECITSMKRNK